MIDAERSEMLAAGGLSGFALGALVSWFLGASVENAAWQKRLVVENPDYQARYMEAYKARQTLKELENK